MEFALLLERVIREKGLTKEEFAQKIKESLEDIILYIKHEKNIPAKVWYKIGIVFKDDFCKQLAMGMVIKTIYPEVENMINEAEEEIEH